MSPDQIDTKKARAVVPFSLARQIRQLLDAAAEEYGDDWEGDDVESRALELVTEDVD